MNRKELYEYLKTLNPMDYNQIIVANPSDFPRSIRNRLIKAINVYNSIKRCIGQNWTAIQYTDKEVILVGIYDEALIGVYVKITYSHFAQEFEAEQVIIEQRSIRHHKVSK